MPSSAGQDATGTSPGGVHAAAGTTAQSTGGNGPSAAGLQITAGTSTQSAGGVGPSAAGREAAGLSSGGVAGVTNSGGSDGVAGAPVAGGAGLASNPTIQVEPERCQNNGEDLVVMLNAPNLVGGVAKGSKGLLRRFRTDGTKVDEWTREFNNPSGYVLVGGMQLGADGSGYVVLRTTVTSTDESLHLHKIDINGNLVSDGLFPRLFKHYIGNCYCHGRELAISGLAAYVGGRCGCRSTLWRIDLTGIDATVEQFVGGSQLGRILLGPPNGLMIVTYDITYRRFDVHHVNSNDLAVLPTGNWLAPASNAAPDYDFGSTCGVWQAHNATAWVGGSWYRTELNRIDRDIAIFEVNPDLADGAVPRTVFLQDSGYDDTLIDMALDSEGNAYLAAQHEATVGNPQLWLKKVTFGGTEVTTGWNQKFPGELARRIIVDAKNEVYVITVEPTTITNLVRIRKFAATGTPCWDNIIEAGPYIDVAYQGLALAPCIQSELCAN